MLLEVCCGSYEDGKNAFLAGAERIELNSALPLGGLTPSMEALVLLREEFPNKKIAAMVRPRAGGFCYTEDEYKQIKWSLEPLRAADAIVFGFLTPDRKIDMARTVQFTNMVHAFHKEAVFHRAIDCV